MELHSLIFESLVERWVESAAVMICTVSQVYSHPLITDLLDQADLVMEITAVGVWGGKPTLLRVGVSEKAAALRRFNN